MLEVNTLEMASEATLHFPFYKSRQSRLITVPVPRYETGSLKNLTLKTCSKDPNWAGEEITKRIFQDIMAAIVAELLHDPVVIPWGLTALSIHIGLYCLFKYVCPDGPWKDLPQVCQR